MGALNRVFSVVAVFTLGLVVAFPSLVYAQSVPGQGLEISPPLLDLKADPGQEIKTALQVRNVTQGPLVIRANFEDFVAGGEDGQPKILLSEGDKSPYSIKDWLSTPPEVTLAPGQRQAIEVSIRVPKDASPGGHYGVVRFSGTPPEIENTGVSLSASVGTLFLVSVAGDITQSAKVAELFTSQNGKRRSLFEYGPIDITTRVENSGNVHFQPKGTVQVKDIFGRTVHLAQFNEDNRNVLPGSVRKFDNRLDKKLLFGRYTVQSDVVYGTENQIASAKSTFWVVPYKLIALILAGIILLILLGRTYNRYIINRASKKQSNASNKNSKGKS